MTVQEDRPVFKIVTIEREYGSGGGAIAKALAARLGWTLWDHEITCEIARRLKCDVNSVEEREERRDPAFYRLVKIFMRGSYEESLGGGAPWFLHSRPDAFHCFVYASTDEKIRRLTAQGKSRREAQDLIQSVDGERAAFIKRYYGRIWPQRDLYHLMVNSQIGDEGVLQMIQSGMALVNTNSSPRVSQPA